LKLSREVGVMLAFLGWNFGAGYISYCTAAQF
jgi:hypothetical protein